MIVITHLCGSIGSLYLKVDEVYKPIVKQLNIAKNKHPNVFSFSILFLN